MTGAYPPRECAACGRVFVPNAPSRLYCSMECSVRMQERRRRVARGKPPEPAAPPATCARCGNPMPEGAYPTARYCSARCRAAAARERKGR